MLHATSISSSIVCLPINTKNESSGSPTREGSPTATTSRLDPNDVASKNTAPRNSNLDYAECFAIDSGYVLRSQVDTLSDFHCMNNSTKDMNTKVSNRYLRSPRMGYEFDYHCLNKRASPQFTLQKHQNYVSAPIAADEAVKSDDQDRSKEPVSKMRRSRINQRTKTQQQNSTGSDGDRNALSLAKSKDARMQWKKLRRDARTKGRTMEQTNQEPTCETERFQSTEQRRDNPVPIENEQPRRSTSIVSTELLANGPTRDICVEMEASQDVQVHVVSKERYNATKVQRLMQQNSIVPPSSPDPCMYRVDSCKEKSVSNPGRCDVKKEPSSSNFKSLMSKWKSIEVGNR